MKGGSDIWIEGEKELYVNMQRHMVQLSVNSRKGLREAGMRIIADAKENLRNNGNVVTGQLRASGKVQAVEGDSDSIDVGFFSSQISGGYAAYVEYGRRAGKLPPVDYLIQWVRKKLRLTDKAARARGWAMAKSIAKKGTKPHPYFQPAVDKNAQGIGNVISKAIKEDL